MQVWIEDRKAVVSCIFSEKEIVKAVGNYKFNKVKKVWEFPMSSIISIIDNLKIESTDEVLHFYEVLKVQESERKKQIQKAEKIKTGKFTSQYKSWDVCFSHQKQALALATLFDSYFLAMDVGTGKSMTTIKLIEHWQVPAMIVAPLSILESVWIAEIAKWSKLTVVNLWHNLKALDKNYDVYLINYEHFKKIKQLPGKIKYLICDESSKLKSYKSQITKKLLEYKDTMPHKLLLSGKPAPNSLLEYWSQAAFINSNLLGDNFFKFRNTYFYSTGYGGYIYQPFPSAREAIMNKVAEQAFFIKKEDCLDLPEQVFQIRLVEMDAVQQKAYDDMKKDNIMEFKDHVTLGSSELAKIMKLRQISGGFCITTEGNTVKISDTKLTELMNVLDEIADDKQVLIWVQFHFEVHMITEALKKAKKSYATLYGDMKQKEKEQAIEDFKNKKVTYLVSHPKSGGMGLNLQQCSYCVWFSMSYSEEEFYQANNRIHRPGQTNKCTYILLHAKRSIDIVIYKALLKKEKMTSVCLSLLKGNAL